MYMLELTMCFLEGVRSDWFVQFITMCNVCDLVEVCWSMLCQIQISLCNWMLLFCLRYCFSSILILFKHVTCKKNMPFWILLIDVNFDTQLWRAMYHQTGSVSLCFL